MPDSDPKLSAATRVGRLAVTEISTAVLRSKQEQILAQSGDVGRGLVGASAEMRVTEWSSPLPPPEYLEQYEQQAPGLRDQLIEDWRCEQAHRREMEKTKAANAHKVSLERFSLARIRTRNALILGVLGLLVMGAVGALGHTIPAVALGVLESLGLWAYVRKSRKTSGENEP